MAFCTNCGAQLAEGANNCTNCGAAIESTTTTVATPAVQPAPAATPAPTAPEAGKGMAIASLVCGLVALFCSGGTLSILALVFGIIAKKQGSKSGMATAGIVLGAVGIALMVIAVVILVVVYGIGIAAAISESAYYYY